MLRLLWGLEAREGPGEARRAPGGPRGDRPPASSIRMSSRLPSAPPRPRGRPSPGGRSSASARSRRHWGVGGPPGGKGGPPGASSHPASAAGAAGGLRGSPCSCACSSSSWGDRGGQQPMGPNTPPSPIDPPQIPLSPTRLTATPPFPWFCSLRLHGRTPPGDKKTP